MGFPDDPGHCRTPPDTISAAPSTEAREGDTAVYVKCGKGRDCPAHREGYFHAHLATVVRHEPIPQTLPAFRRCVDDGLE